MFRIAVCDDDQATVDNMKKVLLEKQEIPCRVDVYTTGSSLLHRHKTYDLIFLDIDMPGIDGIETAKKLRQYDKKVKIVYVTSYRDFAGQAFAVHAFSYMVKPLSDKNIHKILEEAYTYYKEEETPVQVEFETTQGSVIFNTKDIYYFEYMCRKVRICSLSGEFFLKARIADIYCKMRDYDFEMPHKSYVINLLHIRSVVNNDIYMTNGDVVPLSQKKASVFRQLLCGYIEKRMG